MTPQEMVDKIDGPETPYEVYADLNDFLDDGRKEDALIYLKNYFKCTDDIAKEALMIYIETLYAECKRAEADSDASLTPEQIARANAVFLLQPGTIKYLKQHAPQLNKDVNDTQPFHFAE